MADQAAKPKQYPLPDFGDLFFLLLLYFLLVTVPNFMFGDGSTGWHLVTGRYILDTHAIPREDIISYTFPGAPWVAYEWLFDLLLALLEKIAGLNGVAVAASSIIALIFLLLYTRCRREGMNFFLTVVLMIIAALTSSIHWLVRPHLFSFLGVYIFSTTLESFHRGKTSKLKMLAILSASMALWANLHPGFLLGFALTVIYFACELIAGLCLSRDSGGSSALGRARDYFITLAALFLSSLANPYGLKLFVYIAHYMQSSQILQVTNEFESPVFHGGLQPTCLEILFFTFIISLAVTRKRPSFPHLIACLAFGHLALSGLRNAPEFVIVVLPFIANLLSDIRLSQNDNELELAPWLAFARRKLKEFAESFDQTEAQCNMHLLPAASVAIFFAAACNSGSLFGQEILKDGFGSNNMPTTTLDYIRDKKLLPTQGFNYDNWGGYIRYRLGIPVFIDDRLDFYGKQFYLDYGKIVLLEPGWSEILDRHHIQWIIFPKNGSLTHILSEDPHWQLAAQDAAASLFVRRGDTHRLPEKQ